MNIWRRTRHYAPMLAAGAAGGALSIFTWYLIATLESRALIQEFVGRANNQANILNNGIGDYWDRLYAVRAFFESSITVTRDEFEGFSNSLLAHHEAILNLAWIPRVTRGQRAAHELAAAHDGIPDYHIRSVAKDGSLPVSPEQDEYFPKLFSTEARTSRVYGLDLNDRGSRMRTVARIRDGNLLSISPPLTLHIGQGDRLGFWAGVPVYARGLPHESVEDRRRNLIGIVQGVFQISVMIDTIFADVKSPVRVYLFAPNAAAADLSIYSKSSIATEPIEATSQTMLDEGLHRSFPIDMGDSQWTLVVAPEPASPAPALHRSSTIILLAGLLLSGGVMLLMWMMRRYARDIELTNDKFAMQNLQFDAALNNMVQGLLMYDAAGKLVISNRRFPELMGIPWEKWETPALGTTVSQTMQLAYDLTGIAQKNEAQIILEHQNIVGRKNIGAVVFERTDGRTFTASTAPMSGGGFVITFEDITERRRNEDRISHMARYDALTDLPNRVLFYEKMDDLLKQAPQGGAFAVLSLDLDHFKSVNDTLGHPVGDQLLQAAAERMRGCIRETDVAARLGGDEFAILQGGIEHPEDATLLAARLIDSVGAPYELGVHEVVVGTSIGIALAPADGTRPDQLMKNADLALYRCKADGGNKCRFFEAKMDARMQERLALELDLRKAVANGEFTLNYQPIVNIKTGKVTACEALIRWRQSERGWVPPLEFIPIAEATGLIVPIGEWVLRQACADAMEWPGEFTVAVNVSPLQFKSVNFLGRVKSALANSGLPAKRLQLEITEMVLMQNSNEILVLLHELKNLGVSIAMDDFGTGYSSLGYLRRFPFDKIKIDQSFIRDLSKSRDSLAILRAVVGLGRSLGIVTTAEGVETQNQLEILRIEGCTEAQGHIFSMAKSPAETRELLAVPDGQTKVVA